MTDEYIACAELECEHLDNSTLDYCETAKHCPFAHQRRRAEQDLDQRRKDAKERGEGEG